MAGLQTKSKSAGSFDALVNTRMLSVELGIHPSTLAKWRYARRGPPYTRLGNRVLYDLDRVREWLKEREISALRD